jgi:hypothetical protein
MTDDAPTYVAFPGTRLDQGRNLSPVRVLGRSGTATALVGLDTERRLHVIPLDGSDACHAGTIPADERPTYYLPFAVEEAWAFYEDRDETGAGTVHLVDAECKPLVTPMPKSRVLLQTLRPNAAEFVVLRGGDELVSVSVPDGAVETLDSGVLEVVETADYLVTRTASSIVVRDDTLSEVGRLDATPSSADFDSLSSEVAYVEQGTLYFATSPSDSPKELAHDACEPHFSDFLSRDGSAFTHFLSYLAPCESKQLVVRDLDSERSYTITDAASSRVVVRPSTLEDSGKPWIFYLSSTSADTPTFGELAAVLGSGSPLSLGQADLSQVGSTDERGVHLWLEAGTDASRVVRLDPKGKLTPLLDQVHDYAWDSFPERALVDFDGTLGKLVRLEGTEEPTSLVSDAPSLGISVRAGTLYLGDVQDDAGTLHLLRYETDEAEDIADEVPTGHASLLFNAQVVAYLKNYDAPSTVGTLCLRMTKTADTFCQKGVSDYVVSSKPERGVAYVTHDGHLWWAEMK